MAAVHRQQLASPTSVEPGAEQEPGATRAIELEVADDEPGVAFAKRVPRSQTAGPAALRSKQDFVRSLTSVRRHAPPPPPPRIRQRASGF
jgi:hypothetical protein